ncbi:MAG: sigma-70 family RNA polymerase sigma factor, partial [Deltaproteobacteria bacterium]|nr:sigma-70 family RNA polymerase sigma factor [Deltaproteobacteria bacterium]
MWDRVCFGAGRCGSAEAVSVDPPFDAEQTLRAIALHRDRDAFQALFGHYGPRLKAYFLRAGGDATLAEELLQEVMLILWHKADRFDPARAAPSTWIYAIARNKLIDRLRQERRFEVDPHDPNLEP